MAAAPGRFLSSGTKWRPQAEPGGAAFPLPLGYLGTMASALLSVPTKELGWRVVEWRARPGS